MAILVSRLSVRDSKSGLRIRTENLYLSSLAPAVRLSGQRRAVLCQVVDVCCGVLVVWVAGNQFVVGSGRCRRHANPSPRRKFPGKCPFPVLLKGKSSGNSSGKAYQTRNFFRQLFREQRLAAKCSVNLTERIVSIAIPYVNLTGHFAKSQSFPSTLRIILLKSQFLTSTFPSRLRQLKRYP